MELILIIASEEYSDNITSLLVKHGYSATEIGCNGEFLQYGDIVLLLGVEKGEADNVIAILENEGGRHPGMSEPFRGQNTHRNQRRKPLHNIRCCKPHSIHHSRHCIGYIILSLIHI